MLIFFCILHGCVFVMVSNSFPFFLLFCRFCIDIKVTIDKDIHKIYAISAQDISSTMYDTNQATDVDRVHPGIAMCSKQCSNVKTSCALCFYSCLCSPS